MSKRTYSRYHDEPGYLPGTRQLAPGYVMDLGTKLPVKIGSSAYKLAMSKASHSVKSVCKPLVRSSKSVYEHPVCKKRKSIKIAGKAYNDLLKDRAYAEVTIGKK